MIVSNYDLLRQSRRHPVQSLFLEDDYGEDIESPAWLADPSASVEATVEQNQDSKRLYQLLDELPDIYRSVLILVDLYELDYWEIAEILKVPLGTVKSRLGRARLQMKRKLQNNSKYFIQYNQAMPAIQSRIEDGERSACMATLKIPWLEGWCYKSPVTLCVILATLAEIHPPCPDL